MSDETERLKLRVATVEAELRLREESETKVRADREKLRAELVELSRARGRLEMEAAVAHRLERELVETRGELAKLRTEMETRIAEAVANVMGDGEKRHAEEVAAWTAEREALLRRIADLSREPVSPQATGKVAPADFARQLARVVETLGEGIHTESGAATVALTAFDVEARGVLQAPEAGATEPTFVTVQDRMDPNLLSTLRMSFRLMPRVETDTD